ncbi:DUF6011 domain-containing protein [Plantactinospora sp. CA-294935]
MPDEVAVNEEPVYCWACRRRLRTPKSRAEGVGPVCARRLRAAAQAEVSA